MLTQLGGKAAAAEGPVELLLECHGRIRELTALARRLGEVQGAEAEAIREAAGRVRRYFAEALPLHAEDEEASLLPRLRGREPGLDRELAEMAREHREHEPPLARLVEACAALERDPGRLEALRAAVAGAAAELEAHFARHLAREEAGIFPAARRLLPPAEGRALAEEMRARRAAPARLP